MVAAQQAEALLATGVVEGEIVWNRIMAAVNELQRLERNADETLNLGPSRVRSSGRR